MDCPFCNRKGAVSEADVVVNDVRDALDLLLNPLRLTAGLRT